MLIKAKITSINDRDNTCTISMPYFNSPGGKDIQATAVFAIPPDIYLGYKSGDVVIVGFGENEINSPIILGKLYQGYTEESKNPQHLNNIICNSLQVVGKASLPKETEFVSKEESLTKQDTITANDLENNQLYNTTAVSNTFECINNEQSDGNRLNNAINTNSENIKVVYGQVLVPKNNYKNIIPQYTKNGSTLYATKILSVNISAEDAACSGLYTKINKYSKQPIQDKNGTFIIYNTTSTDAIVNYQAICVMNTETAGNMSIEEQATQNDYNIKAVNSGGIAIDKFMVDLKLE